MKRNYGTFFCLTVAFFSTVDSANVCAQYESLESTPTTINATTIEIFSQGHFFHVTLVPPKIAHAPAESKPQRFYSKPMADMGKPVDIIHEQSIMQDLEVIDSQRQQLDALRKEYGCKLATISQQYGQQQSDPKASQEIYNELIELNQQRQESYNATLLPHQRERLTQLWHQKRINMHGGPEAALQGKHFANELNITDEQKEKIKEIQRKLHKDIYEQNVKLKTAAEKAVMDVLDKDQRAKYAKLTGDKFIPKTVEPKRQTHTRLTPSEK